MCVESDVGGWGLGLGCAGGVSGAWVLCECVIGARVLCECVGGARVLCE